VRDQSISNNSLVSYDEPINLTDNGEDSVYGQIDNSGDNTYLVWQESIPGDPGRNYEIFFKKSTDGGNSFEERIQLSDNLGFSEHPQLASNDDDDDDDDVYVVWADNTNVNKQVYFKKSTDGGNSFGEHTILSDINSISYNQEISAFGDKVYIVWLEKTASGPYRVMLTSSTDNGDTFNDPIPLSENVVAQTYPKVSAFDDYVYVTWNVEDQPDAESGVYFVSSPDNGMTFGNISKLNREQNNFGEAQVTSYGTSVYVIWGSSDSNRVNDLSFVKSDDSGRTFSEISKISETEYGKMHEPSNVEITMDENQRIFIAWQDIGSTTGKDEILIASSLDNGKSFEGVTNLSNNTDISECPSITTGGNFVYISWEDLTPGNHEVFFAKGTVL
jgi:hypothetical protein